MRQKDKAEKAGKRKVNDEKDIFSFGSDGNCNRRFNGSCRRKCFNWDSGARGDLPLRGTSVLPGSASIRGGAGRVRASPRVLRATRRMCTAGSLRPACGVCPETCGQIWIWLWPLSTFLSPWTLVISGGTGLNPLVKTGGFFCRQVRAQINTDEHRCLKTARTE